MTTDQCALQFWTDLCEKDDRTSPAEYPDMALITQDELMSCLEQYAEQAAARAPRIVRALRKLVFAARTSGGTAGRDADLCAACDEAEAALAATVNPSSE